jgi:crotonobetainyl-CoA:carnitine CoA-transferase CaiB-like acyl-CoA transferase
VDAGAVQNIADMLERDPQVAHRGFYVWFAEDAVVESVPFKLSAATPTIQREPPPLGADSIRVLRDLLRMPSNEVRELIEAGAVGVAE